MSKIYYNINESNIYYKLFDYTFYFSSEFNKKRFVEKVCHFIREEKYKIQSKYHVIYKMGNIEIYLAFAFYKKIEKRGTKILDTKNILISEI